MSAPLFETRSVTKRYGGLVAVCDVSLALEPGELVGLIGANGAGKTTFFNLVTGADVPTSGSVHWQGRDITHLPAHRRALLGMARTFQNIRLWPDMTVVQNVAAVRRATRGTGLVASVFRLPAFRRAEREAFHASRCLLERLGLLALADERAGDLPYGEQRKLEIARALSLEPQLLLLDEPVAGMNPAEKSALMQTIRALRKEFDLTILLIDHDMKFVMGMCERIVVLDHGECIAAGAPESVRCDPAVIEAYLGATC